MLHNYDFFRHLRITMHIGRWWWIHFHRVLFCSGFAFCGMDGHSWWIQVLLSLDRSLLASASDFGSPAWPCMSADPGIAIFFNVLKSGGCLMNQFANDWDNDSYLGSMDRLVSQKQLDDHYSVWHFLLKLTRGKHNANHQVSTWLGPRSTLDLGTRFEPWVPEFLLFLDDHFIFFKYSPKGGLFQPRSIQKTIDIVQPSGLPCTLAALAAFAAMSGHSSHSSLLGLGEVAKELFCFLPIHVAGRRFFFGKERMGSENVLDIV